MEDQIKEAISNSTNLNKYSVVKKIIPIEGGCIHRGWSIHFQNDKRVFAKSNHIDNINMFRFESECLLTLKQYANSSYIYIPQPLDLITHENISVLCLEWLDLAESNQNILGKGLALMHKSSSKDNKKNFGWETEGFIGSNPQIGGYYNNWGKFFINYRLRPQLQKAARWGLDIDDYEDILLYFALYLNNHNPKICLLHGDLWSGNCGIIKNGLGTLYDPSSYWGDREVDISMTKLFGGFSSNFYKSYEEVWPLEKSAEERIEVYNLYHILNHANIFGGYYKESSISILNNLRSRIK